MRNESRFRIAVLPGDGIGHEVIPACLDVLNAAAARFGAFGLDYDIRPAGAESYRDTGQAMPAETAKAVRRADAILLGAMGLPSVRRPDGTEISAPDRPPRRSRALCRRPAGQHRQHGRASARRSAGSCGPTSS